MRMVSVSAASASIARSASTAVMSGWSIRNAPKALRCRQWSIACETAIRMPADEPIMQSKRVMATISMIVAHAPTLRADHPAERAAQLRLARRVRDIAHLALEADDLQRVLRSVGSPARHEKTRQAPRRLREHEKRVAHRRRDEELVADEFVSLAPVPRRRRESRASCWRARPSRPASRSSPCRSSRPASASAGTLRGS